MNEFDQQNGPSEDTEPLQIANLDCEEPRRRRHVEQALTLLSQSVATPRRRYGLTGFLLLLLLGAVFWQSRSPAPATHISPPPTSFSFAPALQTLQRRPLHLPRVAPGAPCPTTAEKRVNPQFGIVQGDGPAYATPGAQTLTSPAVLGYADAAHFGNGVNNQGWGGAKVIWFVNPGYQGLVLVRGHQIDGPHPMDFDGGLSDRTLAQQLVIDTTISGSPWPSMDSYTRLQAPGCYAYQVDGATFSYAIVFQAVVQN